MLSVNATWLFKHKWTLNSLYSIKSYKYYNPKSYLKK